jgi:hypothetical protein
MNNKGQALIETVLLMGVLTLCWMGAMGVLRQQEFFQKVFGAPWARLSSVIEYGVPGGKGAVSKYHPATLNRHSTRRRD